MKPSHVSMLGLLTVLAGCEMIGSKELAGWNSQRRDRARIVHSSQPSNAQPLRKQSAISVDTSSLRGSVTATAGNPSVPVKTPTAIATRPTTSSAIATPETGRNYAYTFDSDGRVKLPTIRQPRIIDLQDIRQALRGSVGLEFDESV